MNESNFDLGHYELDARQAGFSVLHTAKVNRKTQVYLKPVSHSNEVDFLNDSSHHVLGYMAYSNVELKNEIPEKYFYSFEDPIVHQHSINDILFSSVEPYETQGELLASVNKAQYIEKIKEVKQLLSRGEIYQLNYAIRFRKQFSGSAYAFFLKLIQSNPSQYSAFLNLGDFQIISNSPEKLFSVESNKIITEPIKGTAPKLFETPDKNLEALLDSEKERAELDMITDLARNDIGQICDYGTLRLEENRQVLELPNLWHTYSRVSGALPSGVSAESIFKALFPGGSITGCPKKRAMEYIEKLEGLPRNIFTGSIIHSTPEKLQANIAIRTALIKDGFIEFWAGGGIVMDSNPVAEYEECFLKAQKFIELL